MRDLERDLDEVLWRAYEAGGEVSAEGRAGEEQAVAREIERLVLLYAGMFMCRRIESHRAARPPFQASLEAASGGSPEGDILRCDHLVVECLSLALNCHEGGRPRELGAAAQEPAEQGPGKRQKIDRRLTSGTKAVKGPMGSKRQIGPKIKCLKLYFIFKY